MESHLRNQVIAGIVVLIILALAVYSFTLPGSQSTTATSTAATSTGIDVSGATSTGGYTVTVTDVQAAPDYTRPLTYAPSVSAEVRTALDAQLKATQDILKSDATNFQAWVNLGVLNKMAGDYERAATMWRYVAAIYPSSTVAYDNLASLYLDFLKDYPRAEANFKASIELDPKDINAYQQLVSLYTTYGYKDTAAALTLIEQGLVANPGNETLLQLKAQLSQ